MRVSMSLRRASRATLSRLAARAIGGQRRLLTPSGGTAAGVVTYSVDFRSLCHLAGERFRHVGRAALHARPHCSTSSQLGGQFRPGAAPAHGTGTETWSRHHVREGWIRAGCTSAARSSPARHLAARKAGHASHLSCPTITAGGICG